jgi:hypothetical protein
MGSRSILVAFGLAFDGGVEQKAEAMWQLEPHRARREGHADTYREKVTVCCGEEKGEKVKRVEAFEIWEDGRRPSGAEIKKRLLFCSRWPRCRTYVESDP